MIVLNFLCLELDICALKGFMDTDSQENVKSPLTHLCCDSVIVGIRIPDHDFNIEKNLPRHAAPY